MKFTSQKKQLSLDLFRSSLLELYKSNRWVMFGDHFVKNVMKFLRELCHALNEIWLCLKLIASPVGVIRNPLVIAIH